MLFIFVDKFLNTTKLGKNNIPLKSPKKSYFDFKQIKKSVNYSKRVNEIHEQLNTIE